MRYIELCEGRGGSLYHWMDMSKTLNVLITDTMPGNWTHRLPNDPERNVEGNSFTRDKALQWGGDSMGIRLTVDQRRLAQTNRIIPVDGHLVHAHTRDTFGRKEWQAINSRTKPGENANPSEEFVVGTIKALHRYIERIEFLHFSGHETGAAVLDVVQAYGQKWAIPVAIDPSVFAGFEQYKVWLKNGRFPQKHTMHPDILKYFPDYKPARRPRTRRATADL